MPLASSAYKDNTSDPLPKADYGIKVVKAGYDALTAADNDLLYNSSWPSIQYTKVKRMIKTSAIYTAVPHGLDFPPLAFLMGGSDTAAIMRGCNVDDTNVYVRTAVSSGSVGDMIGSLVIYNVDVSIDIEYPYTATQSVNTAYDPNYGIKVVKPDKDIDSTDMRDYILHSRCGSPLVLAVKTQETVNDANTNVVQYTSKLGYPTFNFGLAGIASGTNELGITYGTKAYRFADQGSQTAPITYTDGFTTQIFSDSSTDNRASIVCLRSPMFAITNTEQVFV